MTVLVTGASGFVGRALCRRALAVGLNVRAAMRNPREAVAHLAAIEVPSLDHQTDWAMALADCRAVVHTAARVHVMDEVAMNPLTEFRRVNVEGTLHLAHQAAAAGVRRFVFVSSIKVNGESTPAGDPFTANDTPAPHDAYGISKMEAELGLRQVAIDTGMEVAIVRPPLVYGPGVKANFASMMRVVQRGIPLPLGSITYNRRSFVALENLVDLLITCIDHPAAANQTFLVSDGEDLSTADLLRRLGRAQGTSARLFPVPPALLQVGANLLGKGAVAQRLLGNLQIDLSHTSNTLNWTPPLSVDEGLRRAVAGLTS
ncbi:UDP-glucose 4-epimerase family protein [Hydrogenophaga sp.]|uniref:UDP-glucose 4-epimerase family protein n=1 Tax=Hydrogenophaga sp. TaxID=1904254 RepID=UPI002FC6090F